MRYRCWRRGRGFVTVIRSLQPDALGRNNRYPPKRFHARPHGRCMMAQAAEIVRDEAPYVLLQGSGLPAACLAVLLFGKGCPQIKVPARAAGETKACPTTGDNSKPNASTLATILRPPSPHPQSIDCLAQPSTSRAEAAFDHPSKAQINPFSLGAPTLLLLSSSSRFQNHVLAR